MRAFLVCYDYGQGGIWLYLQADNPAEITNTYRDLIVFETPPPFWNDELEGAARKNDPTTSAFWAEWLSKFKR